MTASRGLTMAWQQDWSSMSCSGVGLAACPLLARADPPTGFKFEAGALASHAAASLVLRPITAAFVAHAWAPPGNNGSSSIKCPVGFGAMAKDPYTYKTYPTPRLLSIIGTFGPWNIIKVYLKNLGLVGLLTANLWLWEALEAEEKALASNQPPETPPLPDLEPLFRRAAWAGWRELLTSATRRVYEHLVAATCSPRWAWKTLKDYSASLNRKARFYHMSVSWYRLVPEYTATIARCTQLMYAAEWTVSCAYDLVDLVKAVRSKQQQLAPAAQQMLQRVGRHTARVTVVWGVSAAGAAVVATWAPASSAGRTAAISHLLLDTAVSQLVVMALDGGLADLLHTALGQQGAGNSSSSSSSGGLVGGLHLPDNLRPQALWDQLAGQVQGEDAARI